MLKKGDFWVAGGVLLIALILLCSSMLGSAADDRVRVFVDGVQYAELPLGADDEVVITQANGARNCVEIRDGQVRMREANCPTGSCVACGWLDSADETVRLLPDARWIICLPNRVSVELVLGGTS